MRRHVLQGMREKTPNCTRQIGGRVEVVHAEGASQAHAAYDGSMQGCLGLASSGGACKGLEILILEAQRSAHLAHLLQQAHDVLLVPGLRSAETPPAVPLQPDSHSARQAI